MNIDTLIKELQGFCNESYKSEDKEVYKSVQKNYLDGQAGIIINSMNNYFEIYLYIKKKNKIASPLLYLQTASENEANIYYTKLVSILDNENPEELIRFCKSKK